ncbi:protein TRACHEARY ELEMENT DIFFERENTIATION-RELATED 7A-like [Panthera leo]|uniref:protein TRACHEARY ELEMENT DIFFERENTIATION-RELATED 7A-like n=1 Tax=Panthera leo TaxID=9689 RepID=UPI001C69752B|nr:protein TRACHEARY ELEMENT DIFFERENTIATION-RELATED 7A-like [Panthera leo]
MEVTRYRCHRTRSTYTLQVPAGVLWGPLNDTLPGPTPLLTAMCECVPLDAPKGPTAERPQPCTAATSVLDSPEGRLSEPTHRASPPGPPHRCPAPTVPSIHTGELAVAPLDGHTLSCPPGPSALLLSHICQHPLCAHSWAPPGEAVCKASPRCPLPTRRLLVLRSQPEAGPPGLPRTHGVTAIYLVTTHAPGLWRTAGS